MNHRSDDQAGRKGWGSGKSNERRNGLRLSNGGEADHPLCSRGCGLDCASQMPSPGLVPLALHSHSHSRHSRWLVDDLGTDEENDREQIAHVK